MVTIMLGSCKSICCCFLCKNDVKIETDGDKDWNRKTTTVNKGNNNVANNNNNTKTSKDDDVKVICEANLEHILNNQNGSQNNSLYRFVSSNESMSISLHESIIEEEEIEDAEVCDSIVYVVDGDHCYSKEIESDSGSEIDANSVKYIDNDSGSGYSSDVTIVNVNAFDASSHNRQNSAQPSKQPNAQIVNKQSCIQSQPEGKCNIKMKDDLSEINNVQNLSSNCCRDRDSSSQNAQSFDIKRSNLQPLNVKVSAYKSTTIEGKFN